MTADSSTVAPEDESWSAAWSSALQDVEMEVTAAEALLEQVHRGQELAEAAADRTWVAPPRLGPVPPELADRARHLLQRQLDVSERLASALINARSERRALSKLDEAERPPVFVDTAV